MPVFAITLNVVTSLLVDPLYDGSGLAYSVRDWKLTMVIDTFAINGVCVNRTIRYPVPVSPIVFGVITGCMVDQFTANKPPDSLTS